MATREMILAVMKAADSICPQQNATYVHLPFEKDKLTPSELAAFIEADMQELYISYNEDHTLFHFAMVFPSIADWKGGDNP